VPTYPLAPLPDGRPAVISSGFGPRKQQGKLHKHRGADLTYPTKAGDPPAKVVNGRVVYTAQRTRNFFSPPGRVVRATEDGVVVQAKMKPGINGDVWVHHPESNNVTRYAHLSQIAVKVGQRVREGQALGVWGSGEGTPFVHLHFELLTAGKKDSQRDPAAYLGAATVGPERPSARPTDGGELPRVSSSASKGGFPWLLLIGALVSTKS
jgi:murein DD-endopeptidase MepM/ murein hydrolase activator NlpD